METQTNAASSMLRVTPKGGRVVRAWYALDRCSMLYGALNGGVERVVPIDDAGVVTLRSLVQPGHGPCLCAMRNADAARHTHHTR